jgi:hypothetical protein
MVLDDGGFEGIDEDGVEFAGEVEEHFFVDQKPLRTVGEQEEAAWQALEVHADAGAESAEEEPAGAQDSPEFGEHGAEVVFVAGEVQDRGADDNVCAGIAKGHSFNWTYNEVLRRQLSAQRRGQLPHMLNSLGVPVDRKHLAPLAQQVNEIAAVAAAGVEHAQVGSDVTAEELIEEVDVDLAELVLEVEGQGRSFGVVVGFLGTQRDCGGDRKAAADPSTSLRMTNPKLRMTTSQVEMTTS